jgi:hypothetical protein
MSEVWLARAIAALVAVLAVLVLGAVQGFRMLRRWFQGEAPS